MDEKILEIIILKIDEENTKGNLCDCSFATGCRFSLDYLQGYAEASLYFLKENENS